MNKQSFLVNIFFIMLLVVGWAGILFASFILHMMSDMFRLLGDGILVYITAFIYALAFALPIIFRKRISKYLPLALSFIVFTIISVVVVGFIIVGAKGYISEFGRKKWDNNERLRIYMIDDLEKTYGVEGKTDNEIIDLLGQPTYIIIDDQNKKYEYYVGDSMIDPLGYQIEFENNVAVNTKLIEH